MAHCEGSPSDDQKDRLEDFLSELLLISRRYGIWLSDPDEAIELIDAARDTIVGLGLFADHAAPGHLKRYLPVHSILDGAWPVDWTDDPPGDQPDAVGDLVEQRLVQNVFPRRDIEPR